MTRTVSGQIVNKKFSFPFRMILAGSSGAGKTYFAGQLLSNSHLFEQNVSAVHYFYPCYLPEAPVNWHKTLEIPVSYHVGLPTKSDLMQLEKNCCVVIDDSFDEALKSSAIDHLFRVISGKRNICVMIMSQNNFSKGKYGREIRNSCNFSVLFRNCCDVSINENIARMAGMKKAYDSAASDIQGQKYPYMLLDQSQKGQLSPYRLYTNIFDRFPTCYSVDGMKAYVVEAQDFEQFFDVFSENQKFTANESRKSKKKVQPKTIRSEHKKSTPTQSKQVIRSESNKSDLEWGTDSEWSSDDESNRNSKTKCKAKRICTQPKVSKKTTQKRNYEPETTEQNDRTFDDGERERLQRRFEETLY